MINLLNKKINFLILIFFILIIFSFNCSANTEIIKPVFDYINRDDGMTDLSISSITEDKYGFLWFATQSGLNFYNGREFKKYMHKPFNDNGLVHNLIQTMYYDQDKHQLWLGTYQGISQFNIADEKFSNYGLEDGLSSPVVVAITKDINGDFLFGTMNGLNRLNTKNGEFTQYQIEGEVVRDLLVDSAGTLWIASYSGLLKYNRDKNKIEKYEIELPGKYVMAIKEYKPGFLTLGIWGEGVVEIDLKNKEIIKQYQFEDNRIYSLMKTYYQEPSPYNNLEWVGSWGGSLFLIDENDNLQQIKYSKQKNSLNHPIVYSMFQDSNGIIWLGTNGGGLNKINPRKKNYIILDSTKKGENVLSSGKINKIYVDHNDDIWIAVYNKGIERYSTAKNKIIRYDKKINSKNNFPHNSVNDILPISEEELYLGTDLGVVAYNFANDSFKDLNLLNNNYIVYSLSESSDKIWIGTYNNGLFSYSKNNGSIEVYKKGVISDNLIYDTLIDSKNRLWIATNNGLNLFDLNTKNISKFYKGDNKNSLASSNIRNIMEDSNGRVWLGTVGGGVSYYQENGTFKTFIEEDGLAGNVVIGTVEDQNSKIWVATHNGLSIIDPATENIFNLTPADGIGSWEFNTVYNSIHNGNLLFGGPHGITAIPSTFTKISSQPPKVYINEFQLFQNSIEKENQYYNGQNYNFKADQNYLSFEFIALDYDSPEQIQYYYMLEGFDKDWIKANDRYFAAYSNLDPGEYSFKVKAENIRGDMSDTVKLKFKISKPWYQTIPAYILFFLIFSVLIIFLLKIRDYFILSKKNKELERLNNKLESTNNNLEQISISDSLTKVYNRHYFNKKFAELFNLSKRSNTVISLAIFDLDKFKNINDTYGHLVGDIVLETTAARIKKVLNRKSDFIARYGGDEFVVVLYDTGLEGSKSVISQIKTSVNKDMKINLNGAELDLNITISCGLKSLIPDKDDSFNEIIAAADKNLYLEKELKKNNI